MFRRKVTRGAADAAANIEQSHSWPQVHLRRQISGGFEAAHVKFVERGKIKSRKRLGFAAGLDGAQASRPPRV
jgi:hypothetical protein